MKCKCGSTKMTRSGTRQRVKGLMRVWYCPRCGQTKTTAVPKKKGVSLKPSDFAEEVE